MNTEQIAQQIRLAADILETGHPWHPYRAGKLYDASCPAAPEGPFVRLALAVPPDGRPIHNPDNLNAEQVGTGFRLALPDEKLDRNYEYWLSTGGWEKGQRKGLANDLNPGASMRLPLSVPWPEPQPDPYAELKAAHAAGKVIQCKLKLSTAWTDYSGEFTDLDSRCELRIKPTFQLPPPPPGMRWHREDGWQEGDLPQGWRPHYHGEGDVSGDERKYNDKWKPVNGSSDVKSNKGNLHRRTSRPLTFEHAGKQWTWYRPGDPMPCDGERMVHVLISDDLADDPPLQTRQIEWNREDAGDVIGWRYADEKKTVPLGPEDVPPCSVITGKDGGWAMVTGVGDDGATVDARDEPVSFDELKEYAKINRSIPLTGKWDVNAWEPCSKQI